MTVHIMTSLVRARFFGELGWLIPATAAGYHVDIMTPFVYVESLSGCENTEIGAPGETWSGE